MAFIPNPGFLRGAVARDKLAAKGAQLITAAEADAPYRTGHVAGSLVGEWLEVDGKMVYRVTATDFKSRWLEFGTINTPAFHFLAHAAMATIGNLH